MPPRQPDEPAPGDVVDEVVQTVNARLAELQPYLDEAERLRAILAASGAGPAEAPAAPARAASRTPAAAPGSSVPSGVSSAPARRTQGASKSAILAVIAEQPGVTAADIARTSGMKRTVVASTISRLKRNGELEPHGRGVRLPR